MRSFLTLGAVLLAPLCASAATIRAYSFSAAGLSSCHTYGPNPAIAAAMPGWSSVVSTPGPGCSVTEDYADQTASAGTASVATSAGASYGFGGYAGNARAWATLNSLGVESTGTYTGDIGTGVVRGSEAFAYHRAAISAPGQAGSSGYIRTRFRIDGTQSVSGRGLNTLVLLYQVDNGPQYVTFRMSNTEGGAELLGNNAYHTSYPGAVLGVTNTILSDFYFDIAVNFNQTYQLGLLLYGGTLPSPTSPAGGTSVLTNDFDSTMELTGFDVYSSQGDLLNDVQVIRETAAAAVPEPSTLALAGLGAIVVALSRRRCVTP